MNATLVRMSLVAAVIFPVAAFADPESPRPNPAPAVKATATPPSHANPRLKLSYRRFAIGHLDGGSIWLDGAQLDAYIVSRRWVRIGIELEGGAGKSALMNYGVSLAYGLAGASAGFQYPARVTPFLDGRFAGGVLAGSADSPIVVGPVTVTGASAVTWIYGGGLETGVEIYTVGRAYLSASIGWVRTTWRGFEIDAAAVLQNPATGMRFKDVTADSFTFKVGFGI